MYMCSNLIIEQLNWCELKHDIPEEIQIREEQFVSGLDIDHNGVADRLKLDFLLLGFFQYTSSFQRSNNWPWLCLFKQKIIKFLDPKNRFWAAEEASCYNMAALKLQD